MQAAVVELAHRLGYLCAHFNPAQVRGGRWATPVSADAAGFPDLILAHTNPGTVAIAAELKTDVGRVSEQQHRWLDALDASGLYAVVWRPRDWHAGTVEETLRAMAGKRAA